MGSCCFCYNYLRNGLSAGDFEEIYGENTEGENGTDSEAGKWDAVLTCFFIDTVGISMILSHTGTDWHLTGQERGELSEDYPQDPGTRRCMDQLRYIHVVFPFLACLISSFP